MLSPPVAAPKNGMFAASMIGKAASLVLRPVYPNNRKTLSSPMSLLVFASPTFVWPASSRVISSIFLPFMPPWRLTVPRYASAPARICRPTSAVVPVRDADWPINILPAVTPFSASAPVPYAATAASISAANVLDLNMAASSCGFRPRAHHTLQSTGSTLESSQPQPKSSEDCEDEDRPRRFPRAPRREAQAQEMADPREALLRFGGGIPQAPRRARGAPELAAKPAVRVRPPCPPRHLPGDGRSGQGRRHQARDVRRQSPGLPGVELQAPERRGAGSRLPLAHHAFPARARAHRYLQPLLLRGGADRARASGDPARRKAARRAHRLRLHLEGAVSLDRRAGGPPEPQRNAHPQVLPASFEGGTAQALPRAHRRPAQELEIQPRRRRGKKILEAVHEGLPGLSRRDQHPARALVRRPGRRQAQRPADRLARHRGRARRARHVLPRARHGAPARAAGDPQAARQMRLHFPYARIAAPHHPPRHGRVLCVGRAARQP